MEMVPPTSLTQHILKALDCKGWAEVAPKIATGPEAVFPRLFPIVVACADKGDLASRSILSRAAVGAPAKLALAVVGKLGLRDESFILARTGGVFRRTILLDHRVERLISQVCARAQMALWRFPRHWQPPAWRSGWLTNMTTQHNRSGASPAGEPPAAPANAFLAFLALAPLAELAALLN